MKSLKKIIIILGILLLSLIILILYKTNDPKKQQKAINDQVNNKNISTVIKLNNISLTEDIKTHSKNTIIECEVLKGEIKVGDKLKTILNTNAGNITNIRIDNGNKDLKKAKKGDSVQVSIENYEGTNKEICLIKQK